MKNSHYLTMVELLLAIFFNKSTFVYSKGKEFLMDTYTVMEFGIQVYCRRNPKKKKLMNVVKLHKMLPSTTIQLILPKCLCAVHHHHLIQIR